MKIQVSSQRPNETDLGYSRRIAETQTHPQMNKEKQLIAIAEACGWTWIEEDYTYYGFTCVIPMKRKRWTPPNGGKPTLDIPDYLTNLNAMHEAEKMLTEHQWDEYERVLRLVCDGCSCFEGAGKELLHATAAQRAEAFLRTIGEWENDK